MSEFGALKDTIGAFGSVLLARRQFEADLRDYLASRLEKSSPVLEKAGFKVEGSVQHWDNRDEHRRYYRSGYRLVQAPKVKIKSADRVLLYFGIGWRRKPKTEIHLLPFVFIQVKVEGSKVAPLKKIFETIEEDGGDGIYVETWRSGMYFCFDSDKYFRSTLAEIEADLNEMLKAFIREWLEAAK